MDLGPEGLQLAEAATLTFDFSHTSTPVTELDAIFLLTSPLTTLPLYGTVDPVARVLTAEIHQFSDPQPGPGNPARIDAAWVKAVLTAPGVLSLAELQSVYAVIVVLQHQGRDGGINTNLLTQRTQQTIDARVTARCQADVSNPSDAALAGWIQIERLGQGLGADTASVTACEGRVLEALIVKVGRAASADPSQANLARLPQLRARADALGFTDLSRLALVKLAAAIRALIAQASLVCPVDPVAGKGQLNSAMIWTSFVDLDPTVDPTPTHDLLAAIDNCRAAGGGGRMIVKITQGYAALFSSLDCDGHPCIVALSLFGYSAVDTEAGLQTIPNHGLADPPVSLSDPSIGFASSLTQPTPTTLVYDYNFETPRAIPFIYLQRQYYLGTITLTGPGTLRVEGLDSLRASVGACVGNCTLSFAEPTTVDFIMGLGFDFTQAHITVTFTPAP